MTMLVDGCPSGSRGAVRGRRRGRAGRRGHRSRRPTTAGSRACTGTAGLARPTSWSSAVGVRPATGFLAARARRGRNGALRPDPHGRVADHVWAAGDCCEVRRRIDDAWVFRPLGTHANKHGRALGDNLAGGSPDLRRDGRHLDHPLRRRRAPPRGRPHRAVARRRARRPGSTRSCWSPRARPPAATCPRPSRSRSG